MNSESVSSDASAVLISADAHVGESAELRERLPESFRGYMPLLVPNDAGDFDLELGGRVVERGAQKGLSGRDRELEFRSDVSFGTDLQRRKRDMAREGVDAQVVFPNIALSGGSTREPTEFARVFSRTYNEYMAEIFGAEPQRFKPAAMIPTDDMEETLAEAVEVLV